MRPEIRPLRLRRGPRTRSIDCEPLEERLTLSATTLIEAAPIATAAIVPTASSVNGTYSGGVSVLPTLIVTPHEVIPRFVANPTVTSVRSGAWSDPATWSTGQVPGEQDRVLIGLGTTVTYAVQSDARLGAVEVDGSLLFSSAVNTRMIFGTMTVMPTGTLRVGSQTAPVAASVQAELLIADRPLDLVNDPWQYANGLIGLGTVSLYGSPVVSTWSRLTNEMRAGATSFAVDGDLSGWKPGDEVMIADSRQVPSTQAKAFVAGLQDFQYEELVIDHVEGHQVFLTTPLQFDHLGARNVANQLELLPHVALVTRNVTVASENGDGTRGYTYFTARAKVDIRYTLFEDLGRTDNYREIDDTVGGLLGTNVTHVGTNQSGRYAVFFNHLLGPENATNTGYQFQFIGNAIDDPTKWAVAVNDTSFGLIQGNMVYDADGASFVTCTGNEIGNVFANNIAIATYGTYVDGAEINAVAGDYARGGTGFWFRRSGNTVIGNVATDSVFAGFAINGYENGGQLAAPAFRGADPGLFQTVPLLLNPSAPFSSNEAYGMTSYGLWMAFISGNNLLANQPLTTVYNFKTWNILTAGVWAYHTSNLTFNRLLVLGDRTAQDRNDTGTRGVDLHGYENRDLKIINSRIEGVRRGIIAPSNDASQAGLPDPTVIQNSILKNYINIEVMPALDNRPSNGAGLIIRDVKFAVVGALPSGPAPAASIDPPANIFMNIRGFNQDRLDLTQDITVVVDNYNQVPGDDFQVFFAEQAANYVVPQTDPSLLSTKSDGLIGSPLAGLTNAQNWARYGIAIAGGIAPANATRSRSEINGLVAPIQNLAAWTPRVVLVTPWQGAVVTGGPPLRLRYNVNGLLPAGSAVFFKLDGNAPVTKFPASAMYELAPGTHVIHAYIGNAATGVELSGTFGASASFTIGPAFAQAKTAAQSAVTSLAVDTNAVSTGLAAGATLQALRNESSAAVSGSNATSAAAELSASPANAIAMAAAAPVDVALLADNDTLRSEEDWLDALAADLSSTTG